MKKVRYWLLCACCVVCGSAPAQADERILAFHSDIAISRDGSMLVTETIRVRAEGINIRRGLYRLFPTTYRDTLGNAYRVEFDVLDLTRDGQPEPWDALRRSNGVQVNFGDDSFLAVPAEYEYALTYRTTRQLGFFPEWDELYWNVTGNGWDFAIDEASATVVLPVATADLDIEGYTGAQGSRSRNYTATVANGQGMIRTTARLAPRHGLTLVFSWPKGIVAEPTAIDRALWLLDDNRSLLIALAALLGTAGWLGSAWWRVGRDPDPGVIFPHYEPPEGFTPAAARYVSRMGYDNTAFTAAIVNLAVQGHVLITDEKKKYRLQRNASTQALAEEERTLYDRLFAGRSALLLDNASHATISGAQMAHAGALKAAGFRRFFLNNTQYLLPSLIGSLLLFLWAVVPGTLQPLAAIAFGVVLILQVVFGFLMRAPTPEGRKLMDKLDGFKMYLEVAEKDELKLLRDPPQLTPQLFERFLPYAIALGVEEAWAARFERALNALSDDQRRAYHPAWYVGAFNPGRMGDFSQNIGSNFNSAIASAASPPGSTSGRSGGSGGGGSSGGGGGGGGGGGR